jgi:hypothetical protein
LAAISLLWISGCGAAAPSPTATRTVFPSDTPTITPTGTPTPTATPTVTSTFTATSTFTPTLPYNAPGTYKIYKCAGYSLEDAPIRIEFCVNTVNVPDDFTMKFNVGYKVSARGYVVTKYPSASKTNYYLEDNLGLMYIPRQSGGCVVEVTVFDESGSCTGWFLFQKAAPGTKSFRLYSRGEHLHIDGIVLLDEKYIPSPTRTPSRTPGVTYNAPGNL